VHAQAIKSIREKEDQISQYSQSDQGHITHDNDSRKMVTSMQSSADVRTQKT